MMSDFGGSLSVSRDTAKLCFEELDQVTQDE